MEFQPLKFGYIHGMTEAIKMRGREKLLGFLILKRSTETERHQLNVESFPFANSTKSQAFLSVH